MKHGFRIFGITPVAYCQQGQIGHIVNLLLNCFRRTLASHMDDGFEVEKDGIMSKDRKFSSLIFEVLVVPPLGSVLMLLSI